MSKININVGAISELLDLALKAGASIVAARQIMVKHGVDPAVYQQVIDDHRTFTDFHGKNPQSEFTNLPDGTEVPPAEKPPVTEVPPVAGVIPYEKVLDLYPTKPPFASGDHIFQMVNALDGTLKSQWQVFEKQYPPTFGTPSLKYVGDIP